MGGVGDFLFGSKPKQESQSSSESGNHAYPFLAGSLAPTVGYTSSAGNMLASMLGLNNFSGGGGGSTPAPGVPSPIPTEPEPSRRPFKRGMNQSLAPTNPTPPLPTSSGPPVYTPGVQTDALNAFANSTGMNFLRDQGVKAVEGSQAGRGMLQSGATGQALMKFGQQLGNTYANSYMDKLLDLSKLGLGAANTISGAGSWSKGTGTSSGTGGKQGILPGVLSAAAGAAAISDIRLKQDVVRIGTTADGLGIYEYDFIGGHGLPEGRQMGVMAHEVKRLRPDAFVPNLMGEYHGVDYGKLGKWAN